MSTEPTSPDIINTFSNKGRIIYSFVLKKYIIQPFLRVYFRFFDYKVECNICGWRDNQLMNDSWHKNVVCPNCHSEVRHRLVFAVINHSGQFNHSQIIDHKKVLYFAPDDYIAKRLREYTDRILTADFLAAGYKYKGIDLILDISDMSSLKSRSFDCLIALDVLEHVANHTKAMDEIYRVLRKGGCCILTVPQKDGLLKTYEDSRMVSPSQRKKKFGQSDHLRIYGADFKHFLEQSGFAVQSIDSTFFSEEQITKNILRPPELSKRPFATNNRNVFVGLK